MVDEPKSSRRSTRKQDELATARFVAIVVFLAIDVFLVVTDVLGRLFKDSAFHVDTTVFGLAFGATLTLLGLEGFQRFASKRADDEEGTSE